MHRGYTPWRPQHACAQVARTPRLPSLPSHCHPQSLFLSLLLSLFLLSLRLSFSLFRATACSQFVSRVVCTHPVQWHGAASSDLVYPPCPTLPFASSGPRESSYIVSSCRVTPSRRRTSRPRKRFGPPKLFLSRRTVDGSLMHPWRK